MAGAEQTATDLRKQAYPAVKGGMEWLTGLRRSADLEGYDPFGDGYTDYENGFVSVAEGLTAVLLTRIEEAEREVDFGTDAYSQDMLATDLEYILSRIEDEAYRGTPYLEAETTEAFTDGVSYASSVCLLAREIEDLPEDIDRVESAYQETIEWLVENARSTESGAGWAWCGEREMESRGDYYPAQTYFTFSGVVALVDALSEAPELVADEQRVRETLRQAKEMLLYDYRVKNGWVEFVPTDDLTPEGWDEFDPRPSLLSTCYTIWAVCYMVNRVDNISLSDEETQVLTDGMDFVLERIEGNVEKLYQYSRKYQCRRGKRRYHEGTSPYALLNTLLEFNDTFEHEQERVTQITEDLVAEVLDKCWGGTANNPEGGFRHFEVKQVDSERNVTVIYATTVAVESLLAFEIEPPEQTDIESRVDTVLQEAREEIQSVLRSHELASVTTDQTKSTDAAEIDRMNQNHVTRYLELQEEFTRQFEDLWINEIADRLNNRAMQKIQNVPDTPEDIHSEEFLQLLLDRCYFQNDPESFRETVDRFRRDYDGFLLKPFQDELETLRALDGDDIVDPIARKKAIDDVVDSLHSDITGQYDVEEIANDYEQSLRE